MTVTSWRAWAARPFAAPLRQVWSELAHPVAPPERVVRAIRVAEGASEILVAWVQLAGVAFFLLVYAASLPAFDMRIGFEPVAGAHAMAETVATLPAAYFGLVGPLHGKTNWSRGEPK
jgi:hypothetical protein